MELTHAYKHQRRRIDIICKDRLFCRLGHGPTAKYLYLSKTYPSAKFKTETGISLTDLILKKTEEAKCLLCYTISFPG